MDTNHNHIIIQSADTPVSLNQQLVDVDGGNIMSSYDKNDQCPLNVVETEPIIRSIADATVQDTHQMNDNIDSKTDGMIESMEHETIYNTQEVVISQNATITLSGAATDTKKNHDENRNHITSDNDMESEDAMSESLSTTRQNEYINHGLATWEKNREKWLQRNTTTNGNTINYSSTNNHTTNHNNNNNNNINDNQSLSHKHAKPINVDEIIDALFTSHKKLLLLNNISPAATSTNTNTSTNTTNNHMSDTTTIPFPHAVPLPQLVDILQDLWEAEST